MNPFYFGSSKRPLFGIHHPPKSEVKRNRGVVLCPAIGQDYMRTHRGLKQLSIQLSKSGFHVLRFDYFATGDSGGESTEATLEQWIEDVGDAIDELKDTAGVRQVSLIGIRLGAAVAAQAAHDRPEVDSLVLWDPVVTGATYVEELASMGQPADVNGSVPPGTIGVSGFPLTPGLRSDLQHIDLPGAAQSPADHVLLVVSEERDEFDQLQAHLSATTSNSSFQLVPTVANWDNVDRMGAVLLPQKIIQEIVTYLNDHD
jgi:pimeloyl-ACP methyl ester carboxylesterase